MSKKIWLVLVMVMASFFMPNVYAEEENYYELKLYEKGEIEDFSRKDESALVFMLEKGLLLDSYDDSKDEFYNSNNKLLFTMYVDDYSVVVNDKLTAADNIKYTFTTDDMDELVIHYPELASYDGIKLSFVEEIVLCDSVCIGKVKLDSKSDNTRILSDAKVDGLSINFDIRFSKVDGYAKYKIIVNNATDEDYTISEENSFDSSEYVSYEYSYDDGSNIAKSNSLKVMYVTIKYKKQVPEAKFNDGVFTEKNNLAINLDDGKGSSILENPNTGYNLLVIGIVLLMVVGLTFVVCKTTNNKRYFGIIILSLMLIPVSIYAIEKYKINVESKITIVDRELKQFSFCDMDYCSHIYVQGFDKAKEYDYEEGMTFGEWAESKYNVDHLKLFPDQNIKDISKDYTLTRFDYIYIAPEDIECINVNGFTSCADRFYRNRFYSSSLIDGDILYFMDTLPI